MARSEPHANVVLTPSAGTGAERRPPAADLADTVEWIWQSYWDLAAPHEVRILTDSACHLVFEPGRVELVGVVTRTFARRLEGRGAVVGVKLRPAALRRLVSVRAADFADRRVDLGPLLAIDAPAVAAAVLADESRPARADRAEAFVRAHLLPSDPQIALVQRMIAALQVDRTLTTVAQLAARFSVGPRTLQRLFGDYVGVGPKWVIRRCRLLEAAEQLSAGGPPPNLAELASALGYFDQSHFAREFKALVGRAPTAYAQARAKAD